MSDGRKSVIREKSFAFALRIVRLCRMLESEHRERVLGKQLLRSGTAIGALVREAEYAESKADFIHKMSIAQKEAGETAYWLELCTTPVFWAIKSSLPSFKTNQR
ncbi:four helix bundle protein [Dissulfurimicrobium hydrothermale]|uniref:four helix bundle protein n=1 Tax=Dissulfurimicrobium hydrothermale TaxID=1750598 RepID=UPI002ED5B0AF